MGELQFDVNEHAAQEKKIFAIYQGWKTDKTMYVHRKLTQKAYTNSRIVFNLK